MSLLIGHFLDFVFQILSVVSLFGLWHCGPVNEKLLSDASIHVTYPLLTGSVKTLSALAKSRLKPTTSKSQL